MKYFTWLPGRQADCEYKKMCLWSFRIGRYGFDAYILRYPPYAHLPWHTDPVKNGQHWRKNYKISGWSSFLIKIDGRIRPYFQSSVGWFRPDLHEHMVKVYDEPVIKLSIGFVLYNK